MAIFRSQWNPYAAGQKQYGIKGAPNIGPVDKLGYRERDLKRKAKLLQQQAIRRRLAGGSYGSR